MAKISLFLDSRRILCGGLYPLKFRITLTKDRQIAVSTGIRIQPKQYNGKRIISGEKKIIHNEYIDHIYKKLLMNLPKVTPSVLFSHSNSEIKSILLDDNMQGVRFFEFAKSFVQKKDKLSTISSYHQMLSKLEGLLGKEYAKFDFCEINYSWLKDVEDKWKKQGLSINSIGIYMRYIKAIYKDAIKRGLIHNSIDPFVDFKIRKQETKKRALTVSQLIKIINYKGPLQEYADYFILSFYLLGINTVDLLLATPKQYEHGRLYYDRSKTNKYYDIKIEPEAIELLQKYKGEKYLINIMDRYSKYRDYTCKINKRLKLLGEEIGEPHLSTYYARHSWATIAYNLGISKDDIALSLGHGAKTVTDIYINVDNAKVDIANRKVLDFLQLENKG